MPDRDRSSSTAPLTLALALAVLLALPAAPAAPARAADPVPAPAAPAAPEADTPPEVATPAAGAAKPGAAKADPAALEPLAFMTGCWAGEDKGIKSEECWLAPANGLMLGMHRDLLPNGRATFEFLRIEAGADGVSYLASPRGAPATAFGLVSAGQGRVEFANPMHDYPRRIFYVADGRDRLKAAVEGPTGGKTRREEWTWTRKK